MAQIITTGEGSVRRRPDRAVLAVTYTARAADRKDAVRHLTARVEPVERVLDRPGLRVVSRRLDVDDRWEGKRRAGAQAGQWYRIRVTDFAILDDLVGALVGCEPTHVSGPQWGLSQRPGAIREAQRRAVAAARARAEGYAEALGARLGALVQLTDHHRGGGVNLGGKGFRDSAGLDIAALRLEPEPVTVRVRCETVWELAD